ADRRRDVGAHCRGVRRRAGQASVVRRPYIARRCARGRRARWRRRDHNGRGRHHEDRAGAARTPHALRRVSLTPEVPAPKSTKRWWVVPAIIAASAFFLLLAPLWAPLLLRHMAFFRVRHVQVVGARYVQPREILERLSIDTLASVWDPESPLEARIATHPLVREVSVDRKLPGTLVVRLVEHVPVALVPAANGFRAYDERGVALPIDPAKSDVDAPVLARPDGAVLWLLGAMRQD